LDDRITQRRQSHLGKKCHDVDPHDPTLTATGRLPTIFDSETCEILKNQPTPHSKKTPIFKHKKSFGSLTSRRISSN
jgi:hypothetical protein